MIDLLKHAEEILMRALAHGGDLAEVFFEEKTLTSIRFEENKAERIASGTDIGAGIRILNGDRTLYGHTNDVSLKGLCQLADTVAAGAPSSASASRSDSTRAYRFDFEPQHFAIPVKQRAQDVPTAQKIELIKVGNRAARAHDARVVQVAISYADALRRVVIVNSEGRFVEDVRPQIVLSVNVVAAKDGIIQTGYHAVGGALGYELFDAEDPEVVALIAARRACLMLDADPAPTGRMPVVLSSEAGGTMVHEAVGHGLEADHIDKGMSTYCGKLNQMIAAPEVTVVDDATLPAKRGTCNVDDEGTPAERTVLIDQGRLVRYLNDLRTSRKMDQPPTGNGRRESYQCKPIPRMTNTLIAPGNAGPKAILSSTDQGLYVRKMGGGQVNPLNGDFVFEVSEGYLIQSGKAETPVRGATLIGNGPAVLNAIDAIGNDLGFTIGTCGKQGQGAPVSDAQPTLRIRALTIGGTAST